MTTAATTTRITDYDDFGFVSHGAGGGGGSGVGSGSGGDVRAKKRKESGDAYSTKNVRLIEARRGAGRNGRGGVGAATGSAKVKA